MNSESTTLEDLKTIGLQGLLDSFDIDPPLPLDRDDLEPSEKMFHLKQLLELRTFALTVKTVNKGNENFEKTFNPNTILRRLVLFSEYLERNGRDGELTNNLSVAKLLFDKFHDFPYSEQDSNALSEVDALVTIGRLVGECDTVIHTAHAEDKINNNAEKMKPIIQNNDFMEKYYVLLEIARICQLKCTLALMETGLTRAQSSTVAENTFSEIRRQDFPSENEGTSLTKLRNYFSGSWKSLGNDGLGS